MPAREDVDAAPVVEAERLDALGCAGAPGSLRETGDVDLPGEMAGIEQRDAVARERGVGGGDDVAGADDGEMPVPIPSPANGFVRPNSSPVAASRRLPEMTHSMRDTTQTLDVAAGSPPVRRFETTRLEIDLLARDTVVARVPRRSWRGLLDHVRRHRAQVAQRDEAWLAGKEGSRPRKRGSVQHCRTCLRL